MLRSPLRSPLQSALRGAFSRGVGTAGRVLDFASLTAAQLQSRFGWVRSGAGTMTDVAGAVRYGPHNLIQRSEDVSSAAWEKVQGAATPDAGTLVFAAASESRIQQIGAGFQLTAIGQSATVQVEMRADVPLSVNLSAGGDRSYTTVSVTTEWQVFTATRTRTSAGTESVFAVIANVGSSAGTVKVRQIGVNLGSVAFPYVPTTTAPVYLMRTPDYTHGVPGLLLEGARTNLLASTDDVSNAAWTKQAATASANTVVEDSSTGTHRAIQVVSGASGLPFSMQAWVAAGSRTFAQLSMSDNATGGAFVNINLSTGAISTSTDGSWTAMSTPVVRARTVSGVVGWHVAFSATKGAGTQVVAQINVATALGTVNYAGNGTGFIYAGSFGIDQGSYPTSYIPNPATGTMLRVADVAQITGAEFTDHFAAADVGCTYVLDIRFGGITPAVFPRVFRINNGSTEAAPHTLFVASDPANSTYYLGDVSSNATISVTPFTRHKIAFSYKGARRSIAVNGSAVVTDNSNVFTGVGSTTIALNCPSGGTSAAENMTVYSIRVIKGVETTGAALQALTV